MKRRAGYTVDPHQAYILELRQAQARLERLREMLRDAMEEHGQDLVGWADVGEARMVNRILAEAVQVGI